MTNVPFLTTDKQPAIDAAKARIATTDKLTPFDIARIAVKTKRTFYLTCCILEDKDLLPRGTYNRILRSTLSIPAAMKIARNYETTNF